MQAGGHREGAPEHTMTETFRGTYFEVKQQLNAWKDAFPTRRIVREGAAVATGNEAMMLDEPVWSLTVEFEEPTQD